MDKLLATLATAMNEGRGSAPALDAKAVANSLGVPEDAKADVTVKAIAALLGAGDRASKQAALFANSLGVAPEADEAAISAALAQRSAAIAAKAPAAPAPEKQASGDAEVKLLAICNSLGATPDKPLADILALLSATRANPAQSAAEKLIENAISVDHKITPANRDAFVALAVKDFEGTRNILDSMPPILNSVTNAAGSEAAAGSEVLTAADKWACRQGGISEEAFLATRKRLSNQ